LNLDHFSTIHHATLRDFDHFIERDSIAIRIKTRQVRIAGRLSCVDNAYVDVDLVLAVRADGSVDVGRYSFHAGTAGAYDRSIFRYDNAHAYTREGHPDAHHKHRYDVVTGKEIEPPEWIGAQNLPTLRSVLTELERWCLDHRHLLER
jgi:hypothetical protein